MFELKRNVPFTIKIKFSTVLFFRFGQLSPRPTDTIPPLDFEDKQSKQNGNVSHHDKPEEIPIPPM